MLAQQTDAMGKVLVWENRQCPTSVQARAFGEMVLSLHSPLRKLFLGGGAPFPDLPRDVVADLYTLFRPEVEKLERILNRDLAAWKSYEPDV